MHNLWTRRSVVNADKSGNRAPCPQAYTQAYPQDFNTTASTLTHKLRRWRTPDYTYLHTSSHDSAMDLSGNRSEVDCNEQHSQQAQVKRNKDQDR